MVGWEQAMGEGVANEEGAEMTPSGMMLKGVEETTSSVESRSEE